MSFAMKYILSLLALILISLVFQFSLANAKPVKHLKSKKSAVVKITPFDIRQTTLEDMDDLLSSVKVQINAKEQDDEIFKDQVASVLAKTVMPVPASTARESAISRIKAYMPQEEFPEVIKRAADVLLPLAQSSNMVDQATALEALKNLVIEAKHLAKEDATVKTALKKIADANLVVSDEARDYGLEPLKNLISPSDEARAALTPLAVN